jgi:hypothetical protein
MATIEYVNVPSSPAIVEYRYLSIEINEKTNSLKTSVGHRVLARAVMGVK